MSTEIKVPALPESVADATIAKWYKGVGDAVKEGENIVDLETDKVMLEVPATSAGVITAISQDEGAVVTSDQVIGSLDTAAQAVDSVDKPEAAVKDTPEVSTQAPNSSQEAESSASHRDASDIITPSVRRAASEHGVATEGLQGSGKDGRLVKADIEKAMHQTPKVAMSSGREENRVPMSRLRQKVAERLMEAKQNTAMLTTFNEIDMKPVMDLRAQYKDLFIKTHDTKLGFMSFFVKAVVEALKRYPSINASIDGNDIVYHNYFDIGVAVSSPRGLVVPVIRDADQLSMADIERTIVEFGQKAKNNQITIEDMTGGTFTVTNGGVFGSMLSTPILNPPQCGILGMHNIVKRPVCVGDDIVARPIMYVALSYDHQLVDGRESVGFLVTIKQLLEDPARILLGL